MAIGLGGLGLSADVFWRMTPRELEAALTGKFGARSAPLNQDELRALMQRFPDRGHNDDG